MSKMWVKTTPRQRPRMCPKLNRRLALPKPENRRIRAGKRKKKTESRKQFQAEVVALDGKCMNRKCVSVEKRKVPVLQAHHVIPRSLGGTDVKENGLTLCPDCHRKAEEGAKVSGQRLSAYQWTLWVLQQWRAEAQWRWDDSYAWLSKQN